MPPSRSASLNRSAHRAVATALIAAILVGCADDVDWLERRRFAMGTWVDTIHASPGPAAEERLGREIESRLRRYEIDYYAWADGELARLNAALAAGRSFTVSDELADLLVRARELSARSRGSFDPGVGALVEAWGFHAAQSEPREPPAEFLAGWAADPVGIAALSIDGNLVSSSDKRLFVDLGGIAKGEVVDRLLSAFRTAGVTDALVNAGGDVRVLGTRGTRSWSVGIQAPRSAEGLIGTIELHDGEAAFTSGDYERFVDTQGGRRHHLLDPVSGKPATHTQAVTVLAGNGALADAAATAIFVAGPTRWREIADSLGIRHVLRVDADGAVEMTPAMRERVRMQGEHEPATMPGQL